jgi:hypothetical protein
VSFTSGGIRSAGARKSSQYNRFYWKPLTDAELAAQASECVTRFQEWKRKHGRLQFEFLARIYVVENREVMEHLAPVVQECQGNAQRIARAIVPVYQSLVGSERVSYPVDSFALAAAVLLSER